MPHRLKIYFDGGCRPNPGVMEIAVVSGGRAHVQRDCGHGSNMDAEWLALLAAASLARALALTDFILLGDAAAVIAQASGEVRCPKSARRHLDAFRALAGSDDPPRLRHIQRSQNLAGIALARLHPR